MERGESTAVSGKHCRWRAKNNNARTSEFRAEITMIVAYMYVCDVEELSTQERVYSRPSERVRVRWQPQAPSLTDSCDIVGKMINQKLFACLTPLRPPR